ncbi:hypothetical protein NQ318_015363 [Aromia moschata]|uniref:Vacuolar protein sorting-associated protein 13A n=1 Tax=Aromia moschata TaxID=1265417 RepID=A0AAV8YQF4_9CUCU|nr:hypothetical protein NQ318_015363 [Aromia moschata]
MVFEKALSSILNQYLGDFVENLDGQQLNVGIWGGDVQLLRLLIKPSALNDLDLPIQCVHGVIGKLILKIPWKSIYTSPTVIIVEDIHLLVAPNQDVAYNEEKETKNSLESKRREIQKIEDAKKAEAEKDKPKADPTFVEKLVANVIKNVQISIRNIHIRYEDKVTNPALPFAMGFTLSDLEVESTDSNWKKAIVDDISKIYKVLQLEGLSVYWNCKSKLYGDLTPIDMVEKMKKDIATKNDKPENYTYVLGPLNSSARLRMNQRPENDSPPFTVPKIHLNLDMQKLFIGVNKTQYRDIIALADSMGRMVKGAPYRKYRPNVKTYTGHSKEWWHFAYNCVLADVRRKKNDWDWNHMKLYRQTLREYKELYKKNVEKDCKLIMRSNSYQTLKENEKEWFDDCEKGLNLTNIVIIRQQAEMEIERAAKEESNRGWLSRMWGSKTEVEELKSGADILAIVQPIEYVDNTCTFLLRELVVELWDGESSERTVLITELTSVKLKVETRSAVNALKVNVKIDDLKTLGLRQGDFVPEIVISETIENQQGLLEVTFETNPLDGKCDQRIQMMANPIRIVYDAQTVIKILDVFKVPEDSDLDQIQAAADVDIDFSAPYVIIPYGGKYTGDENVLVVNLGRLKMYSLERQDRGVNLRQLHREGLEQRDIFAQLIEHSYDRFKLELTDLQILVAQSDEDWKAAIRDPDITEMHMLSPLNLSITYAHCLIVDDPRLPLNTVTGELPSININISEARVMLLAVLGTSIPLPSGDVPEPQPLTKGKGSSRMLLKYKELQESAKKTKKDLPPLPPDSDRKEFVQFTTMQAKFVMSEFAVTIIKQASLGSTGSELACFKANSLECNLEQQTYNTKVSLLLGSILLQQNRGTDVINIISTSVTDAEKEYLLKVQFTQVDIKSPELHSTYKSCETSLLLDFRVLGIILHQEGLLSLIQFSTDLQDQIMELTQLNQRDRIATARLDRKISTISESSTIQKMPERVIKTKSVPLIVETIKFKLKAELHEVTVKFATDKNDISSCAIKGINADIIVKDTYTQVNAKLQEIVVIDLNPQSLHKLIMSGTEDCALIAQIVLNNLEGESEKPDMDVTVKMGGGRIVFLNWFVSNMLNFLNQFQAAQQAIIDASQAAAESAKENMKEAYTKATKISLSIDIKAPDIIVPVNSQSYDALFLDLGVISLSNKFLTLDIRNEEGYSAVVDELQVNLSDLKVARVKLNTKFEVEGECTLLEPINLHIVIKRNLSTGWYNSVPDIDISGKNRNHRVDYQVVMSILSGNLAEGQQEKAAPSEPISAKPSKTKEVLTTASIETTETVAEQAKSSEKIHVFMKFTFVMEKFIISMYTGGLTAKTPSHDPNTHLGKFSLELLSLKGRILSDQSIVTSILLVDCLLDDMRKGREGKLTRLIERSAGETEASSSAHSSNETLQPARSMIDITFQQKQDDMFADVRVCSLTIILSVEYLLKIANFFTTAAEPSASQEQAGAPVQTTAPTQTKSMTSVSKASASKSKVAMVSSHTTIEKKSQTQMTVNLKLEKPDIILVEHMDNINTKAMILNSEILVKLRMAGEHQVINGTIRDLQLYTCDYNPAHRAETKANILHPVNISLAGSTPEGKGLHIELLVTDIYLGVSPATIELLNRVMVTMNASDTSQDESSDELVDYTDIWQPKAIADTDYWYLKTDMALDAFELNQTISNTEIARPALQELCIISMPSVVITIEAGVGNKTLPMLLLETSFKGSARNWSSQMSVEASLTVQMGYYNSRLALWEPLIEPVEIIKDDKLFYAPWELKLELSMTEQEDPLGIGSPGSEAGGDNQAQPVMNIDIISESTLELTVTKTCLEVLQNLGKAFATAIQTEAIKPSTSEQAPYKSSFKLAEGGSVENINKSAAVPLQLKLTEEASNRIQLSKELTAYSQKKSCYLHVKVKRLNWELSLPVVRADKRFFMLNYRGDGHDNWGIISDIKVDEGVTIITLRSIIQVYNHFNTPVDVYFMTTKGNELELVGTVSANSSINLPLKAVYTPTSELFFTVAGYSITCAPYVWKDLQTNLSITKLLQCPHKDSTKKKEPFIFKVVGETEQVYYENTSRHTMASTCFNVHLRPAVIMTNCLPIDIIVCVDELPEEFTVKPGDTLQLPTVDPGRNALVIRIPEYLEKEWSCRQEVSEQPQEFSVWTFHSYDSAAKMTLDLGMHTLDKNGSLIMSLYCPFWMLNKTGLMIGYRVSKISLLLQNRIYRYYDSVFRSLKRLKKNELSGSPAKTSDENLNILYHPAHFKGPILFSFNPKNFFGKKKASIRVEYGEWSDKFSLDVAGSSGLVTCKTDDRIYQIGVHIQLTYNTLTKQVTFIPYYVIINNAPFPIECQESDRPADPWVTVEPKSCSALWARSELEDKQLHLRVPDSKEVTASFIYTESHNTLLRLNNKYGGINVDIQMTEGAVYISLASYEAGSAPALIVNYTDGIIKYWEKESVQERFLEPKHSVLYTWENPSGPRILCWDSGNKKDIQDDLRKDSCGEFSPNDKVKVYWASFLDGMQRVLLLTHKRNIAEDAQASNLFQLIQQEITMSIHGLGLSLINNFNRQEIMYLGIASSGIIWEACKLNGQRYKPLGTKESTHLEAAYQTYLVRQFEGEEVSSPVTIMDGKMTVDFKSSLMTKPTKRKIRRTFETGLWVQMKTSPSQTQLHAKINRLQIDDQMFDSTFPVILAPVPPPKSVAIDNGIKPFVEVSIVQLIMKNSQIRQFKYFKVLVQEFHIKVDLGFVNAIFNFLEQAEGSEEDQKQLFLTDMNLVDEPLYAHASMQSIQEQKSFYDLLHFSPLKVHISFSMAAGSSVGQSASTPNFLNILLQSIGVTLTDLQDVVFKLSYFERDYTFLTQKQLVSEATSHYVGQTVKQLYVLVLGLDVIGNPYGLVLGITKGVEDLFYEPFQVHIALVPFRVRGEFAEGLALGVKSLFGHTVGGAVGAVSRITGAVGKGIAALTFDEDYQRKRREALRKKPTTAHEGIARSGKGLVMGFYSGVTGVFTKPVEGAKEQGVEGFFKGLGKGAVGLVTRPVAGVVDFASGSLDVVKRCAESGEDTLRLRLPRFLQADGLVRPYNKYEADGHRLLSEMAKGKYSPTDVYVSHYYVIPQKEILLLTDKRLAYVSHNDMFGGWQVEWSYTWDEITQPPKVVTKGVMITTGEKKKKLFGSTDLTKTVLIDNPAVKEEICLKIESLRGA